MFFGAIIGLGHVALEAHIPAWKGSKNFKILAGCDKDAQRQNLFRKSLPEAAVSSSLEDFSKYKLDFIDIATPPHTHFPIIIKALENGWNVLCEKPLVLKEIELNTVQKLARDMKKVVFTVHNWKFAQTVKAITGLIRAGAIGKIKHVTWEVFRTGPSITTDKENWRLEKEIAGGGILVDHGWHAFYILLDWIQMNPNSVLAQLENKKFKELNVEDSAYARIQFGEKEEISAEINLTWATDVRKNSALIEGEEGQIIFEDDYIKLLKKNGESKIEKFSSPLSQGSHHPEWFGEVIQEFEQELTQPNQAGKNFSVASACLQLLLGALESNREKKEIFIREIGIGKLGEIRDCPFRDCP